MPDPRRSEDAAQVATVDEVPETLRAEGLAVGYDLPLVRDVDVEAGPGELIALLGPNGAGKSTLLRCLAGVREPLHGVVRLGALDVSSMPIRRRARRLALVQARRPRVPLTVEDLVGLGRAPHTGWTGRLAPPDVAAVERALETAGVARFRDRPCSTLSDGEAQRAVIARCLAQEADVVLLDEPTAHLDAPARVEILSLLRRLTRDPHRPRTVVVAMHELDLAFRTSDRLWLLASGRLISGVPEDLVLDGSIGRVFSRGTMVFDETDAAFRARSEGEISVRVEGSGVAATWTRRAVRRIGGAPIDGGEAPLSIAIRETAGDRGRGEADRWSWELETPDGRTTHHSIADLLERLGPRLAERVRSR